MLIIVVAICVLLGILVLSYEPAREMLQDLLGWGVAVFVQAFFFLLVIVVCSAILFW